MSIYFGLNVEHRNLTEKFWEVFLSHFVVLVDQRLPNFLFNLLLGFDVEDISVVESVDFLHVLFLSFLLLFHPCCDYLLEFGIVFRSNSSAKIWILIEEEVKLSWIVEILLLQLDACLFDLPSCSILKSLVKHVALASLRGRFESLL